MSKTAYDLIAKKLESIEKTISVQQAGRIMRDKDVSSLVILDREGRPEGVLTERDIVRKICTSEAKEISTAIVGDIMSSPLITIDSKSTPEQAGELFLKNNIRHLLVVSKENGLEKPLLYIILYIISLYQVPTTSRDFSVCLSDCLHSKIPTAHD